MSSCQIVQFQTGFSCNGLFSPIYKFLQVWNVESPIKSPLYRLQGSSPRMTGDFGDNTDRADLDYSSLRMNTEKIYFCLLLKCIEV